MSQYQNINIRKVPEVKIQFLAEVQLGIQSNNCRNFGICNISPIGYEGPKRCCGGKSVIAVTTIFNNNRMDLDFLSSSIPLPVYWKTFSTEKFLVQEKYQFYYDREMELKVDITPGTYKIEERAGFIKVKFRSWVNNPKSVFAVQFQYCANQHKLPWIVNLNINWQTTLIFYWANWFARTEKPIKSKYYTQTNSQDGNSLSITPTHKLHRFPLIFLIECSVRLKVFGHRTPLGLKWRSFICTTWI